MCFAPQRRALFEHLSFQKCSENALFYTFRLGNVLRPTTARAFATSRIPKVLRTRCVLYILTSTCASRHNGVHSFNIPTSKSAPGMACFVHVGFDMCFGPQRRALFQSLNLKTRSGVEVFLTFGLRIVLRATACNSTLWSHKPLEKRGGSRLFCLFARLHLLSSDSFFSDLLSSFLLFSDSSHLCFSSVDIVGSLTSKLPSTIVFCS